jgi:hypothetical protein
LIEYKALKMSHEMQLRMNPGQYPSIPARQAPPSKPPYVLVRDGVITAITTNGHFSLKTLCKQKQLQIERKGLASTKRWQINGAEITACNVAPDTDTDCKDFSYYDMLDGWIHYVQILAELEYPAALIQDRLDTYRWLQHGDWPNSNKCDFMHAFLLAHPQTNIMWKTVINTDCNLLINTHLNKAASRPAPNPRRDEQIYNPSPGKKPRIKPNPRKQQGPPGVNGRLAAPAGPPPTAANKQAQFAALKQLQLAAPGGKLRICYASNDASKSCLTAPCPFAHVCIKCAGPHTRAECKQP